MAKKNYYKILGVSRTASPEEISAAKNRLAKKYHPDANMKDGIDTTKKMQRILEAYRILSDPKKRASYDRKVFGKPSSDSDRNFDLFNLHNPFASAEVNTLPRGVVIRNSFFCAIYSPSILQCGNPPNRLSDQDNTLQCLNRTSFRSAGLSIS